MSMNGTRGCQKRELYLGTIVKVVASCQMWMLGIELSILEDQQTFSFYYLLLSGLLVMLGVESRALPSEVSILPRLGNLSPSLNKTSVCLLRLCRHKQYSLVVCFLPTAVFIVLLFLMHACIFTHITSRRTMLVLILTHKPCVRSREQSPPVTTVRSLLQSHCKGL